MISNWTGHSITFASFFFYIFVARNKAEINATEQEEFLFKINY